MEIIGVALTQTPIATLSTSQHCAVSLNNKRAVLTTYDLNQSHTVKDQKLQLSAAYLADT